MRNFMILIGLFVGVAQAQANEFDDWERMSPSQKQAFCDAGSQETTLEINACASLELSKVDQVLNHTYQEVMKKLKGEGVDNDDAKSTRAELIDAQRKWIAFRDADCGARYTYHMSDTIRSLVALSCKITATKDRESALRAFYLEGMF